MWRPTPKSDLVTARRLDPVTGEWTVCQYKDLKKGDIFKAIAPDGSQVCPAELEPVDREDHVAVALGDPIKGASDRDRGYGIEVLVGPLDELMKQVAN